MNFKHNGSPISMNRDKQRAFSNAFEKQLRDSPIKAMMREQNLNKMTRKHNVGLDG